LAHPHQLRLSIEWLPWTILFLLGLGAASGDAQMTPSTPPTNVWAPEESNDWFLPGNWSAGEVPTPADDVGIGAGGPAVIGGDEDAATAHTVTLGVVTEGYAAGELDVTGGTLNITPTAGTVNPGLQILSGSTLDISEEGTVNVGAFTVDNFGTIDLGAEEFEGLNAGTIRNENTGLIEGVGLTFGGAVTVVNAGVISSQTLGGNAITVFGGPGTITNSGTITSPGFATIELDDGGSIANTGKILATGGAAIEFFDGGSLNNGASGTIAGTTDGVLAPNVLPDSGVGTEAAAVVTQAAAAPAVTIINSGAISGATGIQASSGGSVTNNAGGVIQGTAGDGIDALPNSGVLPPPLTVVNSGTISGTTSGIDLTGGGSITNNAGGTISAATGNPAVIANGGPVTFSNAGTINGSVTLAALPETVSVANQATLVTGGKIAGDLNLGTNIGTTLTLDGSGSEAVSQAVTGVITNDGSVIKQGSGTWVIDKSLGDYAGGTTVNAGTLTDALTNALGTGPITVTGGTSLLQVNPGITIANPNIITITQGGSITNSGTIFGPNGISITGGGSVVNNAGGVITGSSGLAILSAGGSAKISNAGTINGNVSLGNFANTVQLFSGGRINGNLNLGTSAASNLILDGSGQQNFSQAVSGTTTNAGTLTKQGSGNWTVDVAMSAPVSTNILAGVLTVNQTLKSPLVTIQAGGVLKGSSFIIGNVVNGGTISPGNSPGTLNITGNFTQGPGGTFNVDIVSPQNYSQLLISGHANLDGTLHLTLASGLRLTPGETFTVLKAGGGISGTFRTISSNSPVNVSYANGVVDVNAVSTAKVQQPGIHLSDGTPDSTTALLADYTFYGFGSLSERMALGITPDEETDKENAVSLTFDAGEFDIQGQHGQTYTIPIAGGFKINDRVRLDYEIPLQYITIEGTSLFQAGLTLDLPVKVVIPSADRPWSWTVTPTAAIAASGSREIIGGGALTNVFSYQWHGITATYGNYISFFQGDVLTTNDPKFPTGVSQQIMKNGLRFDIPFAKSWIFEFYGIYTQFFQSAAIGSYATIGAELGHHFTWSVEGQNIDLGYLSLGLYTEFGNQYSSGHAQIGSGWRF
jgi:autotransporter-associated beta strand protein